MLKNIIIIGAGGHGHSVAEAIELNKSYNLVGFFDDTYETKPTAFKLPVFGPTDADFGKFKYLAEYALVAIGNNEIRQKLQNHLSGCGFLIGTVIHPKAIVSAYAKIGEGSTIMAGAIIGTNSNIGQGVIVNSGAIVDHDCKANNFSHLGVGACMSGGSILGVKTWMQAGSSLNYGVHTTDCEIIISGTSRNK